MNKVWEGYLNPYSIPKCPHCDLGYSPEAKRFNDEWYGYVHVEYENPYTAEHPIILRRAERNILRSPKFYNLDMLDELERDVLITSEAVRLANHFNSWMHHLSQEDVDALVAANRLMDFTHTCRRGEGWKKKDPPVVPTAAEVNEWSLEGMGHDSINNWVCVKARCEREGVPYECSFCEGSSRDKSDIELVAKHDAWEATEPPEGEGWQLWETVSEGSPVSPVFSTPEQLARWLADHPTKLYKQTFEEWMAFMDVGWAPSLVDLGTGLKTGVAAISERELEEPTDDIFYKPPY
jgi:hypothetical protein